MIKISLVDFDNTIYHLYCDNMAQFDRAINNVGNEKWKSFSVRFISK